MMDCLAGVIKLAHRIAPGKLIQQRGIEDRNTQCVISYKYNPSPLTSHSQQLALSKLSI